MNRSRLSPYFWCLAVLAVAGLLVGCEPPANDGPQDGSETHWFQACSHTNECMPGGVCIENRCIPETHIPGPGPVAPTKGAATVRRDEAKETLETDPADLAPRQGTTRIDHPRERQPANVTLVQPETAFIRGSLALRLTLSGPHDGGVARLRVDGLMTEEILVSPNQTETSFLLDTKQWSDGGHALSATVAFAGPIRADKQLAASDTIELEFANYPPTIQVAWPVDGSVVTGSPTSGIRFEPDLQVHDGNDIVGLFAFAPEALGGPAVLLGDLLAEPHVVIPTGSDFPHAQVPVLIRAFDASGDQAEVEVSVEPSPVMAELVAYEAESAAWAGALRPRGDGPLWTIHEGSEADTAKAIWRFDEPGLGVTSSVYAGPDIGLEALLLAPEATYVVAERVGSKRLIQRIEDDGQFHNVAPPIGDEFSNQCTLQNAPLWLDEAEQAWALYRCMGLGLVWTAYGPAGELREHIGWEPMDDESAITVKYLGSVSGAKHLLLADSQPGGQTLWIFDSAARAVDVAADLPAAIEVSSLLAATDETWWLEGRARSSAPASKIPVVLAYRAGDGHWLGQADLPNATDVKAVVNAGADSLIVATDGMDPLRMIASSGSQAALHKGALTRAAYAGSHPSGKHLFIRQSSAAHPHGVAVAVSSTGMLKWSYGLSAGADVQTALVADGVLVAQPLAALGGTLLSRLSDDGMLMWTQTVPVDATHALTGTQNADGDSIVLVRGPVSLTGDHGAALTASRVLALDPATGTTHWQWTSTAQSSALGGEAQRSDTGFVTHPAWGTAMWSDWAADTGVVPAHGTVWAVHP